MLPIPGRWICFGLAGLLMTLACLFRESPTEDFNGSANAALIRALAGSNAPVRQKAMQELMRRGTEAIPDLVAAAREASVPLVPVSALGDLVLLGEGAEGEAAELALESLCHEADTEVASAAAQTLGELTMVRHRRAVLELRRLGAQAESIHREHQPTHGPYDLDFIVFGSAWTGGAEGLRHINRLANLQVVYLSATTNIKEEDLAPFRNRFPRLQVTRENEGCLGVVGQEIPDGFYIDRVIPGSPADRIGLHPGDLITRIDRTLRPQFGELSEAISRHAPGDSLTLAVRRRSFQNVLMKVQAGTSFGVGTCQCDGEDKPASALKVL